MAKENHTFSPLPEGARIISEKDGERIAGNGITLVDTSKEKQAQQAIPTVEEAIKKIKIAKPKKMHRFDDPNTGNINPPSQIDRSRIVPGTNVKKKLSFGLTVNSLVKNFKL
ncbi:hypothetical protein RIVM261_007300 [Rivularia sp. IAM M-261]|nr:hypothetical protein RIVM261_007300 [Rivularia sp. IAM M-261]